MVYDLYRCCLCFTHQSFLQVAMHCNINDRFLNFFFHLQRNWNIPKHLLNNCKSSPPPLQQGSRGNRNVSEIVPTKNLHWLTGVWIVHIPLPIQSDSFWSIDFLWISIRCRPCALLPPTVRDHTERRDLSQLAVSDRS